MPHTAHAQGRAGRADLPVPGVQRGVDVAATVKPPRPVLWLAGLVARWHEPRYYRAGKRECVSAYHGPPPPWRDRLKYLWLRTMARLKGVP